MKLSDIQVTRALDKVYGNEPWFRWWSKQITGGNTSMYVNEPWDRVKEMLIAAQEVLNEESI